MANKIYLGTVWVNGEKQAPVASYARIAGDDNVVPIIEVKDSEDNDHNILWVICHGKLLAAEPLLVSISYDDLLLHGYLFGQPVTIDGQEFNIRMVRDFEEWTEFGSVGESAYALHGTGTLIGGPVDTTVSLCSVANGAPGGGEINSNFKMARRSGTVYWRPVLEPTTPVEQQLEGIKPGRWVALWGGDSVVSGILKEINNYDLILHHSSADGLEEQDKGILAVPLPNGRVCVDKASIVGVRTNPQDQRRRAT